MAYIKPLKTVFVVTLIGIFRIKLTVLIKKKTTNVLVVSIIRN
jgi:hypothetical protein